jgi:hypothetical protein
VSETLRRLWEFTVPPLGSRESAQRLQRTQLLLQAAARPCPPSVSLLSGEACESELRHRFPFNGGILSPPSQGLLRCLLPRLDFWTDIRLSGLIVASLSLSLCFERTFRILYDHSFAWTVRVTTDSLPSVSPNPLDDIFYVPALN